MDPDLQKKWKDAMETAKLTGGGGGNGVDTANIMLGQSVSQSVRRTVFFLLIIQRQTMTGREVDYYKYFQRSSMPRKP